MKTPNFNKIVPMLLAAAMIAASSFGSCSQDEPPGIADIQTGWQNPDGSTTEDGGSSKPYVQKCPPPAVETVSAEGEVLYDGTIPTDSELSVAITTSPPPGMPSCYFTRHANSFPFKFRFENLEKGSKVYVMAVLKVTGGGLPIPTKCVDYYGDLGSTPMELTGDVTGLSIKLDLYKKSECP